MNNISFNNIPTNSFFILQNKLLESMKDVSKRVLIVALIAFSGLTALYLLIKCCHSISGNPDIPYIPYNPFSILKKPEITKPEEIIDISTDQQEKKAIEELQGKWLDDPKQEAKRVLKKPLIPKKLQPYYIGSNHEKYAIMGRVLEIKKLYKNTHYVFTHGQASQISIVNKFVKECTRIFSPGHYHPLNDAFRLPNTITYSSNANEFIDKYKAQESSFRDDGNHSDKMISVDAQFTNQSWMESALDFFSKDYNISYESPKELNIIFNSIFSNYLPNKTICNMLAQKATAIAIQRVKESKIGVLYAICIPKATVQNDETNFTYPCHAFGIACKCFPASDRIKLLEQMQQDRVVFCTKYAFLNRYTQYRILTSKLAEEKGVRSFGIDALPKKKVKLYQNQIEAIVKELKAYSYLSDLIDQLDDDPAIIEQITSLRDASPELEEKYVQLLFDETKQSVPPADYKEPWMID